VRRVGDGKAAAAAVLEQDVDVLAGEELQALAGRQLELEAHHVGRQRVMLLHAAGQLLHRDVAQAPTSRTFDHEVRQRPRAAEQGIAPGQALPR
jgi:hypothetical protein